MTNSSSSLNPSFEFNTRSTCHNEWCYLLQKKVSKSFGWIYLQHQPFNRELIFCGGRRPNWIRQTTCLEANPHSVLIVVFRDNIVQKVLKNTRNKRKWRQLIPILEAIHLHLVALKVHAEFPRMSRSFLSNNHVVIKTDPGSLLHGFRMVNLIFVHDDDMRRTVQVLRPTASH